MEDQQTQEEYCEGCFYFREKRYKENKGSCHYWPPVVLPTGNGVITTFPEVVANEWWCGEWTAKSQKMEENTDSTKWKPVHIGWS
jgi:hypothetical protein